MKKYNGEEIELMLLESHMYMQYKPHWLYDNIGIVLAIGLMVYVAIR